MLFTSRLTFGMFAAVAIGLSLFGCHKPKEADAGRVARPKPVAAPSLSQIDLRSFHPNEAGAIMVVMYHRIEDTTSKSDMFWSPENFRKDLETLYAKGYRPVTFSEMVENRMDVPAGKSPIVLTFDDSYPSQFQFGGPGTREPDPNCAVGIMEDMHRRHPDWATKATFFVLTDPATARPFGEVSDAPDKFAYLVQHGYEIGSHTTHHRSMRHMTAHEVEAELGTAVRDIQRFVPNLKITSLALPMGYPPRDKAAQKALLSGEQGGTHYEHDAVAKAAWRPVMSPITKTDARPPGEGRIAGFDPVGIERFGPVGDKVLPHPLDFYVKYFDENPGLRYVSDGNPNVVAVPSGMQRYVDEARVRSQGKTVQIYSADSVTATTPAPR